MATKKGKRMTVWQKKQAAEERALMRELGLIPAKKKPLNRGKFVDDAKKIYEEESKEYSFGLYLRWALAEMMGHRDTEGRIDLEAVGAAKIIHLAKRRRDFEQAQKAQGKEKWSIGELCDAVMDVYQA